MVTQSRYNWDKHKEELSEIITKKYGEDKSKIFMNHYCNVYEPYKRSFMDYKLAFSLLDDWHYCRNIGTKWYAFVGVGGTGKSTLAKNVFKFLDPTFTLSRTTTEMKKLIEILGTFTEQDVMKAIYLDEPDDEITAQSKQGRKLRKIFGKIRQQKCFIGICATDLKDIPPYIFRKLDGIFFTPSLGRYMFFKNQPKKKIYVLQELRMKYAEKGYNIFFQLQRQNKVGCLYGRTHKVTPLDNEETKYLKSKRKDYEKDIKSFIEGDDEKTPEQKAKENRQKIIMEYHNQGLNQTEIAKKIGTTKGVISRIIQTAKFF